MYLVFLSYLVIANMKPNISMVLIYKIILKYVFMNDLITHTTKQTEVSFSRDLFHS